MPRVVMVIGPCGAGKSTVLRRMRSVLGSRVGEVAVLETDTTYMMIDPTWALFNSHYWALAVQVAARITTEFIRAGFDLVAIGSNGLLDHGGVDEFVAQLPTGVDVHYVFLNPSVEAVQARMAARAGNPIDDDKTPEWVEKNVMWMRGHHNSRSALIDNTGLDVDETVDAIYAAVEAGAGRIA